MDFYQIFVICTVIFLVVALYKELFNPAATFAICAIGLLLTGVLSAADLLKGLANPQIIVIFLLILITAGLRIIYGGEIFTRLFSTSLSPKAFLARMMISVSTISAFLNNTPIVAFMIPYVKDWADRTGNSSSKFLIPLSFATILGGMITVIGTSTNLVLNGLIQEYNLPTLRFTDFLFLGVIVTAVGLAYLYFIGYHMLPSYKDRFESVRENLKEYIVETEVFAGSSLIGKSIKDAGLRNLKEIFLVEIVRDDRVISPVTPETVIAEKDMLFFSGNVLSIYDLVKNDNGLRIPRQDALEVEEQFNFIEAVVPVNSDLIGKRIRDSDFRKKFNASIIAVHRDGKKIAGRVGEMVLSGGDFLLLLSGDSNMDAVKDNNSLYFISIPKGIVKKRAPWLKWFGIACFGLLIMGITGIISLFSACAITLTAMILLRLLDIGEIRRQLDLSLLIVLVCSLAIGMALEKTGAASVLAHGLLLAGESWGPVAVLACLFFATTLLTAVITNAAAVAIMFPVAMALAAQMNLPATPFFVAIAFSASGDFMTPIGYQTNLMVYGPGGYSFRDFTKVGAPLTLLYLAICVGFISFYYHLI